MRDYRKIYQQRATIRKSGGKGMMGKSNRKKSKEGGRGKMVRIRKEREV